MCLRVSWVPAGCVGLLMFTRRAIRGLTVRAVLLLLCAALPAKAEQSGFDPRQTESRFDGSQLEKTPGGRPALGMPTVSRPAIAADDKPLFILRRVSLTGEKSISSDQMITAYQPYLGKN